MKKLLVLGGSEFQIHLLKTAKKMGLHICLVDINENAPALKSGYYDEFYKCSLKDYEGILNIAKRYKPNGVTVGMVDVAVPACAYVAQELGLPGLTIDTALKATDKNLMIRAFNENNVPSPKFIFVDNVSNDFDFSMLDFPLIVKPIDMAGSRGIFLVNNEKELQVAINKSSNCSNVGKVLVEEYLDGPEVSVELIITDGIPFVAQITDKTTTGAPHFAEIGHLQPSMLPNDTLMKIKEVACMAAQSLGLQNSLGHAEIKVTSKGPKMIEIGARAGGDAIGEQLLELSTGINFSKIALQIALGEKIEIPSSLEKHASCIRFLQSKPGKLLSVAGIENAKNIRNVTECEITGEIGKVYGEAVDNSGRWGYVIASAKKPIDALKACDEAIEKIKFEVGAIKNG